MNVDRGYKAFTTGIIIALCLIAATPARQARGQSRLNGVHPRGVRVVTREAERRVDVTIDGKPFTSYIWPEALKKPVLFPLRAADGTIVTRGYPLEPRAGERADHPHQVGVWLNYGDVNGVDFWNNSTARTPQEGTRLGTIVHRRVVGTKDGAARGELSVEADWLLPDGSVILRETTKYVFHVGTGRRRAVDRTTTLKALDRRVLFKDSKEGLFGLRVRRELEQPSPEPLILVEADGSTRRMPEQINTGLTGRYRSSEGLGGDDVWGTRGRWTMLAGTIEGRPLTLAILDHPQNVGHPTYWMARGYGLFAANPLGQKAYSTDKKEPTVRELNFALEPQAAVTFKYRLLIFSSTVTPRELEAQYESFRQEVE